LDSDCIIPEDYLEKVLSGLELTGYQCFGGPDAAHESFTDIQKAISYSMTSFYTTGGIRGGTKRVGVFHPRGFNMGIRREVFKAVGGYSDFRCGEDIELSIRIIKAGYSTGLLPEAYVYHKRRTNFAKFYKQVFRFGAARINLYVRHKEELKLTHFFPSIFTLYWVSLPIQFLIYIPLGIISTIFLGIYKMLIFIDSTRQSHSVRVGYLSVLAAFVQLTGYGFGFFRNAIVVFIFGNKNGMKL
jgi:cellulose synthase/poly-beta-1,6-N-acetylglucosamine synthase-like glycosyltransferase